MRLSDADRDAIYEQLARHHAEGRLSVQELERRVSTVVAAETRAQAAQVLADLPAVPFPPQPLRRGRGHAEADSPHPGWRPTAERFRDPRTRRVMRVWVDASGARHYVAEDG